MSTPQYYAPMQIEAVLNDEGQIIGLRNSKTGDITLLSVTPDEEAQLTPASRTTMSSDSNAADNTRYSNTGASNRAITAVTTAPLVVGAEIQQLSTGLVSVIPGPGVTFVPDGVLQSSDIGDVITIKPTAVTHTYMVSLEGRVAIGEVTGLQAALDGRVIAESGKGLSQENYTTTEKTKLGTIEDSATADQTGAEIKTLYEAEADTNAFTDALKTKLDGIETGAEVNPTDETIQDLIGAMFQGGTHTNVTVTYNDIDGTIDVAGAGGSGLTQEEVEDMVGNVATQGTGITVTYDDAANALIIALTGESFTTADHTKLDGIETGATADQTGAEIKTLYEAEADTNAFTDADHTKLDGIETGATADQTGAEIKTLYEGESDTNAFTDADHTKLDGIEAGATANSTDATLLARANHTGTQVASTISDFTSAVTGIVDTEIATLESDVSTLQSLTTSLDTDLTAAEADIDALQVHVYDDYFELGVMTYVAANTDVPTPAASHFRLFMETTHSELFYKNSAGNYKSIEQRSKTTSTLSATGTANMNLASNPNYQITSSAGSDITATLAFNSETYREKVLVEILHGATSVITVVWPANVTWVSGSAPDFSTDTAGNRSIVALVRNHEDDWDAFLVAQDVPAA